MAHQLEFEKLLTYDVGDPGITLQASLKLKEQTADLQVKVDTGASCFSVRASCRRSTWL